MNSEAKNLSDAGANTAGHTPWPAEGNRSVVDARGEIIAMTNLAMPGEEAAAIALLIAAAPDLLAALRQIAAIEDSYHGGDWDEINEAREIARVAIARAEGKA